MLRRKIVLRDPELYFLMMVFLNFINIVFCISLIVLTQYRVVEAGESFKLLDYMERLPQHPVLRIIVAVGFFIIILYCIYVKGRWINNSNLYFIFFFVIEIIAAIGLMCELNMSSNGIIFLIMAEMLSYTSEKENQLMLVVAALILYLVCNYYLVSMFIPINSMDVWLSFYGKRMSGIFFLIRAILDGTNILFFVSFVLFMLVENNDEKESVQKLNDELQLANTQLLNFAKQQELVGEMKERNRLAREIHDTIGHQLTGISVGVEAASVLIDEAPEVAKKQLELVHEAAKNGLMDVRRSVRKLQPDALDRLGLNHAIHKLVADTASITDTNIVFTNQAEYVEFEKDEEETIYRIIQECCTNAIRHGHAPNIWIQMREVKDKLILSIRDNGQGVDTIKEGFGLSHMRERVELLQGEIQFASDVGFLVYVKLPIRRRRES